MAFFTTDWEDHTLKINLKGRLDATSVPDVEKSLLETIVNAKHLVIDFSGVEYISSIGLRMILKLKKIIGDVKLVSVSTEAYEILEMTGFTEMMEVHKAFRTISVEGCEVIGDGATGVVYRIDDETIVKAYRDQESLDKIRKEIELSRSAFVLGVPTAIPFDIVQLEDGRYGSVFELLNASSLCKMMLSGEKSLDEIAAICNDILKSVHSAVPKAGALPARKTDALRHLEDIRGELSSDQYDRMHRMLSDLPDWPHMIHGDFHIKNIMMQNGESLLIDMDTICTGDPVFEFAGIYNAYIGFSELDHENDMQFFGIPFEQLKKLYDLSFDLYFEGVPEEVKQEAVERIRLVAACRLLRFMIKRAPESRPDRLMQIRHAHEIIDELISRVESVGLSDLLA